MTSQTNPDRSAIFNNCAFYNKCSIPKNDFLCNKFPDFMICPEYNTRKEKITK